MARVYPGRRLEGPPFGGQRVKTALSPRDRHALAKLRMERSGEPCQATVRAVIDAGLKALGWPEERREREYRQYCASVTYNDFEGR